jgi:hypothetical protein
VGIKNIKTTQLWFLTFLLIALRAAMLRCFSFPQGRSRLTAIACNKELQPQAITAPKIPKIMKYQKLCLMLPIKQGDGNDLLHGGAGDDVLQGDAGSDGFLFDGNTTFSTELIGRDTIVDFVTGIDKILLDKTTFTTLN